jgi:hypothetical protein
MLCAAVAQGGESTRRRLVLFLPWAIVASSLRDCRRSTNSKLIVMPLKRM